MNKSIKISIISISILLIALTTVHAAPIVYPTIVDLGNNYWKVNLIVKEGETPVAGVCVYSTNSNAFAAPTGNKFKCAVTNEQGFTQYIFVGQEGISYYDNWIFEVTTCSDFCCCQIPEDPFEQGCLTLVCSETNQNLCQQDLGGVWDQLTKCNLATSTCEAYTAIVLSRFDAIAGYGKVSIKWSTETEIENAGFNVYRAEQADGEYVKVNRSLIAAKGYTTQGATYVFIDTGLKNRKTYYYKLEDIDLSGISTMHGPVSATPRLLFGFRK